MKKHIKIILGLIMTIFLISGCSNKSAWDVRKLDMSPYQTAEPSSAITLRLLDGNVNKHTNMISFVFENLTSDTYVGGIIDASYLEIYLEGKWYQAPLSNNYSAHDIAWESGPHSTSEEHVYTEDLRAPLIAGHYRIIYNTHNYNQTEYVICEFDVL